MRAKRWVIASPDTERVRVLSRETGYTPLTAAVLSARGIDTPQAAADYLSCDVRGLHAPFGLTDMDKAVEVVREVIDRGEKMVVYGDYDVDGITATCTLVDYLRSKGAKCEYYIPNRLTDGYGLTRPAMEQLYEQGREKGIRVMDAPVSGGDSGARNATLSIMVGGDEADFAEAMPLFECMGKNIILMGPAGSGQHTKAANQIAVAGATAAYTEALVYAQKAGLDPQKMLSAIGAGAAGSWQLTNMAPRALAGDFAPGFFIKHFIKDMKIVQEESRKSGVELEMLDTVLALYEKMAQQGLENDGTQALIKYYQK